MLWNPRSFHIELTTSCSASCPFCPRTKNISKVKYQELTRDDIEQFFTEDVLNKLQYITLCGSFGDPIYARDFLSIVEYFDSHGVVVAISTNGYNKKKNFWEKLGSMKRVRITFGIDGITQKTHGSYRVGTELKTVLGNAKKFIDAGGNAEWQFLVFQSNEYQVERAEALAKQLGFNSFFTRESRQYSDALPKPLLQRESGKKKYVSVCEYESKKQWYLTSAGFIIPCCHLGMREFSYEEFLDEKMNIRKYSFGEIQRNALWLHLIGDIHDERGENICERKCAFKKG